MYCGKCGAVNDDDAVFCSECGTPFGNSVSGSHKAGEKGTGSEKNNRLVGFIAIGVVAVAAIVTACILIFGGRSVEKTVDQLIENIFTVDGESMLELMPDDVFDVICEEEGYSNRKELADEIEEAYEEEMEYYDEFFDEWEFAYEIINIKDFSKKKLKDLSEEYEDEFDIEIKKAKTVTVEFTVSSEGGEEVTNEIDFDLIKLGRSWYVEFMSFADL